MKSEKIDVSEQLKEMGNNVEIPESLKPNNIEHLLEDYSPKKHKLFITPIVGLVAAMIAIVLIPTVANQYKNKINNDEERGTTYQTLYELFSKNQLSEMYGAQGSNGINQDSDAMYDIKADDNIKAADIKRKSSQGEEAGGEESEKSFSKVNSQVEEVSESDIVVTDGDTIYVARKNLNRIEILGVNNTKLTELSSISLDSEEKNLVKEIYIQNHRLVIMGVMGEMEEKTYIAIYDVSDPQKPTQMAKHIQDGNYETSRLTDGYLYTFSVFCPYFYKDAPIEKYVPSLDDKIMREKDIQIPESKSSRLYYVMTSLKLDNPVEWNTKKALLASYQPIFYVSQSNIYLAMESNIYKYSYKDGQIGKKVECTVKGTIHNQFSLDEYEGNLRVVVTYQKKNHDYNAVYVLDKDLKEIGSIGGLAKDEDIYSARFMGDKGYFVTFRETDPLFSVDFSVPSEPKIIGRLKIPGFSDYLHFYGDGLLLGIGKERLDDNIKYSEKAYNEVNNCVKISMFDISNPKNVKEISKTVLKGCYTSEANTNHKSILIDIEKNIIGFPAEDEFNDETNFESYAYYVYSYNKGKFVKKLKVSFHIEPSLWKYEQQENLRGIYIGDNLYVINTEIGVKTYDLSTFSKKNQLKFSKWK